MFNIRFVSNKRGQLSTCGDDVNKGGLSKFGGKNIDLPTLGRRHENINTKCALYTQLYAWIINSFVHTRAYINANMHTICIYTCTRIIVNGTKDDCCWRVSGL